MRRQFGKTIVELAEKDPKLILLYGDVFQQKEAFQAKFPERIFNVGICEQTIIGMAAGMALQGLHPVVYSITSFLVERPFEFLKMDLEVMKTKVMLIGYDFYPTHGPSQSPYSIETTMSIFKNIKAYYPKDFKETHEMMLDAHDWEGPSFIRLTKAYDT